MTEVLLIKGKNAGINNATKYKKQAKIFYNTSIIANRVLRGQLRRPRVHGMEVSLSIILPALLSKIRLHYNSTAPILL